MAATQDDDLYPFQSGLTHTSLFAGQDFDDFLETPAPDIDQPDLSAGFLNPNDLAIKRESESFSPPTHKGAFARASRGSASGSSSSSSESPADHNRNTSATSTASPPVHDSARGAWGSGINGFSISSNEQMFEDTSMAGMDQDFEASNQQMATDFDFDTAASTPSGFDMMNKSGNPKAPLVNQPFSRPANFATFGKQPATAQLPTGQAQFFFAGSRETSPLNAMLPPAQGQSPWNKHSPSSGLEETFNHITMNGDSPGNATFSPNLQFSTATFSFDPESSTTPSTFTKDISSPPSTINSEGSPTLTVHPTSLKSRVETQIPIKMTLSTLPPGVKKLRLPRHTVSKPKFLAKPEVARSSEILELYTSLVCTSAMQDSVKLQRALARAKGEELGPFTRPSPASSIESGSSKDDEDKPLNGGEVHICTGCVQRERKRASRKKQKKPEEEELFQKDEERRVVVFNTNEIKDWTEAPREPNSNETQSVPTPSGSVQVELPMRIACYCRHQNEKLGFQVIFTIKDCRDKVIAQALTNPIMITDDHKTHNPPASGSNVPAPLPTPGPQLPGAGVFSTTDQEPHQHVQAVNSKMSRQSYSMTDLHALQHNFNPNFSMPAANSPFAIPSTMQNQTAATFAPRNLSRPASPSGPAGPTTKRRKQSGSGKVPSGLTMTRLDTPQTAPAHSTMPNTAASSPYAPNMASFIGPNDRHFAIPSAARPAPYSNSPPTPNGVDSSFVANFNRSVSHDHLSQQVMISAPPSRQPSRPGSPGSARNSFSAADAAFGQAVSSQLMGHSARRPPPLIHKLVPAEGSLTGGTEVTLLGNGFYQGLEVMFGDTEATTTTFWGEKCLNCIAPPALQPGVVPVVFKHDHPQYSAIPQQSQMRPSIFTYVDDRELEMFRLALRTLGKTMPRPTDDPYAAAQQLLQQGQPHSMWLGHGNYGIGGGHQRGQGYADNATVDTLELEATVLQVLEHMDDQRRFRAPNFDLRRPSGLTLLHLAASLGLTRFVAGLLSRGADPNLVDNNGHTPMHHAAMNGHTHVIHRLRLAGANHKARSIHHFTPADLATSLLAYQATMTQGGHYRSRSAGGTPMRMHSRSSSSLRSFWENASNHYTATDTDDMDDADDTDGSDELDDETPTRTSSEEPELHLGQTARGQIVSVPHSRRGSMQPTAPQVSSFLPESLSDAAPAVAPPAFMLAWRDHLVAQLQQFNESAQSVMPSLANLNGPLAALQDYQAYPMVRRVSALFPQRPSPRQQLSPREGWWESLTGSSSPAPSSPPAYGDLYPEGKEGSEHDWSIKKAATVQAAADATADLHFEQQSANQKSEAGPSSPSVADPIRKPIERVELSRDRKLFFFWVGCFPSWCIPPFTDAVQIPLFAIVLALMIRSSGLTNVFGSSDSQIQPIDGKVAVDVY